MRGAIEVSYLQKMGVKENQIKLVPNQPSAISLLQSGRVDAITMTGPSLEAALKSSNVKDIVRVKNFKQPTIDGKLVIGYGAAAFRKDDQAFRDAFTKELEKMEKFGELLKTIQPFGFTEENLPGDVTSQQLCKG
jgi:polar amino acid transport system substrate-binding protein